PIDIETGRSLSPAVLPGWGDVAIRDHFTDRFPVPVFVENDVNVLALAEHRRHPDSDDILVIKASTGIGAAIIGGGQLQRGALGASGELGHAKVSTGTGAICRCGDRDCLEAYAAGWALRQRLQAAGRSVNDARDIAELVRAGDPEAVRLVRDAGRHLGEVLAVAVNLLNPSLIVIGGDLAHAYDTLVAGVRELVYQRSSAITTRSLRIIPSELDEQAGFLACAWMTLDNILSPAAINTHLLRPPAR
ncbi:MAG: ROK family protein, partial [Micromonosporaceae bacterium]